MKKMVTPVSYKIDVDQLLGIRPLPAPKPVAPSIAELAAERVRKDLKKLIAKTQLFCIAADTYSEHTI